MQNARWNEMTDGQRRLNSPVVKWHQHNEWRRISWDLEGKPQLPPSPRVRLGSLHLPADSDSKESVCSARDWGLTPGLGRSPGGGHGSPLQCSCPENPMDRGAWRLAVHGEQRVRHACVANTRAHHLPGKPGSCSFLRIVLLHRLLSWLNNLMGIKHLNCPLYSKHLV